MKIIEFREYGKGEMIIPVWSCLNNPDNNLKGYYNSVLDSGKLLEKPLPYWVFQWLCKNHFDFQFLINNELAVDINTLSVE